MMVEVNVKTKLGLATFLLLTVVGNGAKGKEEHGGSMHPELISSCASSRHEAQTPTVFSAI